MFWGMRGLYFPMFLLTLFTETPALKYLYRKDGFNWKRAIKVSFGLNLTSYLFIFFLQFALIFAYFWYADLLDKKALKNWNDTALIKGETGYIYAVEHIPSGNYTRYVLKRYDVEKGKWERIDSEPLDRIIDPVGWDARGNLFACTIDMEDWDNQYIAVIDTNTSSKIMEIKGGSHFKEIRISPDLTKLAALKYVREIYAPKDDKSAFMLGLECKLQVYDIKTGLLLYEAPRPALNNGLTWAGNSKVIFASLRDPNLFKVSRKDLHVQEYFGRAYAKKGQFPIDLFLYDLKDNSVKRLTEGEYPQFISATKEIVFLREGGLYQDGFDSCDLWRGDMELKNPHLVFKGFNCSEIDVSPSGEKYLVAIPRRFPFGYSFFLTVVDSHDKNRRLIIEPDFRYQFRWADR